MVERGECPLAAVTGIISNPKVTSVDTAGNFKSLMYIFSSPLMEQLDKG